MPTRVRSIHFEPDEDGEIRRAQVLDEILLEDPVTGAMRPTGAYVEPRTIITEESHPAVFAALRTITDPQAAEARIVAKRQERSDAIARAEAARQAQEAERAERETRERVDPFRPTPENP